MTAGYPDGMVECQLMVFHPSIGGCLKSFYLFNSSVPRILMVNGVKRATVWVVAVVIAWMGCIGVALAEGSPKCLKDCITQGAASTVCLPKCGYVAQTEYRCLALCLNQGTSANSCRQSCAYMPALPSKLPADRTSPYSQFTMMQPSNGEILLNPQAPQTQAAGTPARKLSPTSQPLSPSTDYKCLAQCTQNGMARGYCQQTCSY